MKKAILVILIYILSFSLGDAQAQSFSRDINVGWNWIGFPHSGKSLVEALAPVNPVDGDYIKSQSSSSTFYDGYGWFGELSQIEPLQGYHLKISHTEKLTLRFFDGDGSFTDARDKHTYKWVRIGTQVWMAENLAWLPSVTPSSKGSNLDPFYYVYGYEGSDVSSAKATSNYAVYGVIYNWEAAKISCPEGWRLPSDEEWTFLTDYLINNNYGYTRSGDDIAKSMASTSGWEKSQTRGDVGNDQASNNSSGFNAIPGGSRGNDGGFYNLGYRTLFWSTMPDGSSGAWYRGLYFNSDGVRQDDTRRGDGFSVRCLQN